MRNQTLGMLTDSIAALPPLMSSVVPEVLSLDSRAINRGDAFVAIKGAYADGPQSRGYFGFGAGFFKTQLWMAM